LQRAGYEKIGAQGNELTHKKKVGGPAHEKEPMKNLVKELRGGSPFEESTRYGRRNEEMK